MDIADGPAVSSVATGPFRPVSDASHADASHAGPTFHDVLSALNPLQYLPVVGTIYRAVTGDTIPEAMRVFGSLAVSGLMGGPVGMLLNLGSTVVEKVTGIDPDRIAHRVALALGLTGPDPAPAPAPAQAARVWTYPAEAAPEPSAPGSTPPAPPVQEAGSVDDAALRTRAARAYGRAQAA